MNAKGKRYYGPQYSSHLCNGADDLGGSGPAEVDASPRGLLEAVYASPASAEDILDADEIYSDRLQYLFKSYFSEAHLTPASANLAPAPVNLVPFDPLSLAVAPSQVNISEPLIENSYATANVNFDSDEGPVRLSVSMIEEAEGWRIDDVASFGDGDKQWLLSWMLRYDPAFAE